MSENNNNLNSERVASIENRRVSADDVGVVLRYANRLVTHDIAKMDPVSQNLMSLLFAIWTKTKQSSVSLPLNLLKEQLNFNNQSERFIEKIVSKTSKDIIEKSFVHGYDDRGRLIIGYMIYQFTYDFELQSLEVKTSPDFMELFGVKKDYVSFDLIEFYNIKPKQAKNLYRLFCRNFKGHFSIDWEELRAWMGYKPTATNANVMTAIKTAINYLKQHKHIEKCEFNVNYEQKRGNPIKEVSFEYEFPARISSIADSTADKNTPESSVSDDKAAESIETRPYTKEDETALWDDFKPREPEPEAAIASATPPDFNKITAKSKNDVHLPTLANLPPLPPKESEPEPKPLEHHCTLCGKPMQMRQNKETGAYFWGCDRGHPTITLTPEEVRQHKNQKNSVNTRK